ncbi:hypothetical protein TNIN_483061 [Trichonephila inaurata madagascariensis]|uniref:Uncharacterized protein n=1 Tax=Trichonephila inaurata madagascariensis TaxID=2747483 RepID=A0A8X6YPF4_9ARAC|nr:hypothetical protein TNIN_483061 [Trichonephila inaurata madagascariensis]
MFSAVVFTLLVLPVLCEETHRIVPWVPTAASNGSDIVTFAKFNDSITDNSNETAISNASNTTGNTDASVSWNFSSTTEGNVIDANGCMVTLRNRTEEKCYHELQDNIESFLNTEDEEEMEKGMCCAVEEYEKCCIEGFKSANCEADQKAIKSTVKAASVFIAALHSVSCAGHRGKCSFNSSVQSSVPSYFLLVSGLLAVIFA